jgi:hypothetical protein
MTGNDICRLMRRHKMTIKLLAQKMGLTMKHVRHVRQRGTESDRDWVEAITGADPGTASPAPEQACDEPMPSACRVTRPSTDPVAEPWPNRLGWTVGDYEVGTSEQGWLVTLIRDNEPVWTVPVGERADPVAAVHEAVAQVQANRQTADAEPAQAEPASQPAPDLDAAQQRPLLLLPPNLAALAKLASKEGHSRYSATAGVRVQATRRGYRVEATEGHVLAIVKGEMPDNPDDYPAVPGMEHAKVNAT